MIPNYRLYGERSGETSAFWLHSETISVRSRLHNWRIAIHRHAALFQIFWVTAGDGTFFGDGLEPQEFAAPCTVFIPPDVGHGFHFSSNVEGLVTTVLADRLTLPSAADPAIDAYTRAVRITGFGVTAGVGQDGARMDALFSEIHLEIGRRGTGSDVLLEALVTEVIVRLSRAGTREVEPFAGRSRRDEARMRSLEALISAHFRQHRPVRFYAERMGISPGHLNRLARQNTGLSVQQLTARRLAEAARRDLIFTPTSVQAIAYGLGFQDPAYFNRFFRRHTGATPGAYRAAARSKLAERGG